MAPSMAVPRQLGSGWQQGLCGGDGVVCNGSGVASLGVCGVQCLAMVVGGNGALVMVWVR